jgi:hypothetical protein
MNAISISYQFLFESRETIEYTVSLDSVDLHLVEASSHGIPEWALLTHHTCPNCTLDQEQHRACPLAYHLVDVVNRSEKLNSYDDVTLRVVSDERTVIQKTTVQRAIGSLAGLISACSGCPYTSVFRPMARFHLPLSTEEETVYRATSMYLLAQYFIAKSGGDCDYELKGLRKIYENLDDVNRSMAKRIREASKTDSTVNAIILLDLYSKALPDVIDGSLEEIRYLFESCNSCRLP